MNTYVEKLGKVSITVDTSLWDYNKSYEKLTIVKRIQGSSSGVYLSRVNVPENTAIDAVIPNSENNDKYWLEIINSLTAEGTDIVDALAEEIQEDGIIFDFVNDTILEATKDLPTKEWVENKHYLTEHQDISCKADKVDTYTKNEVYSKSETYSKSEVYTKAEVLVEIADAIIANSFEVYSKIEDIEDPKRGIIYLIGPKGEGSDKYEEYVYIEVDEKYTLLKIGDTSVDLSGKADKVINATNGNFASLDGNGNLKDSGKNPNSFVTPNQANALTSYVVCNTNGDVQIKQINITGYSLVVGSSIKVKFTNKNTAVDNVALKVNDLEPIPLKYNSNNVSNNNTWDSDEIVNLFYDGTCYQSYNVEGGGLLNKQTIPPSSQASEKKGLTEKTISLTVEALQNDIDTIAASSSVVGISGSVARFVQSTEGTTENINIRGTCNPSTSIMTLQQYSNDAWGNVANSPNAVNEYIFTRELLADSDYTYRFRIVNQIRNTEKVTSDSYVYYVRNIYIGTILTSELAITDPEEAGYIADFSALINKLSTYSTPTTSARTTYPNVGFDNDARRIVMINPKVNVTNINPDRAYMTSVIDTNRMPFTLVESGSSLDRLMDSNFNIYISDNSYNPGGPRNLIFTN